jgi:hypothetical protein
MNIHIPTFIAEHLFWTGVISMWVFCAAVYNLPDPTEKSSGLYRWVYGFLHQLAANFDVAFPNIPGFTRKKEE